MSDKPKLPNLDMLDPYAAMNLPSVWTPTGHPIRTVMFGHPRPPLEVTIKTPQVVCIKNREPRASDCQMFPNITIDPVEVSFETLEDYYGDDTGFNVVDLRRSSHPTIMSVTFDEDKMQVVSQSVLKAFHDGLQKAKLEDGTWVNGISEYGVNCKGKYFAPTVELTIYDWPSNRGVVLKLDEDGELSVFIYHDDPRDSLPHQHHWHLNLRPEIGRASCRERV